MLSFVVGRLGYAVGIPDSDTDTPDPRNFIDQFEFGQLFRDLGLDISAGTV